MKPSVAVLLIVFGVVHAAAQVPPPTDEGRQVILPKGLSEDDILRAVIPSYDLRIERAQEAVEKEQVFSADLFEPSLDGVLETDFGWGKGRYLVVAISGYEGPCAPCIPFSRAVVLRKRDLSIAGEFKGWTSNGPEYFPLLQPRLVRLWPHQRTPIVAIQSTWITDYGSDHLKEEWFQPSRLKGSDVSFERIWSFFVERGNGGNRGGSRFQSCGKVIPLDTDYFLVTSTYYGETLEGERTASRPLIRREEMFLPDRCVMCRSERMTTVEIRTVQNLRRSSSDSAYSAESVGVRRIDHAASKIFPFSLPVREAAWLRCAQAQPAILSTGDERSATSPGRRFVARVEENRKSFRRELIVKSLIGDEVVRVVPLTPTESDYFDGIVKAVGLTRDESRVFIVITFGHNHTALLSFSVEGNDDYWEGLVDPDAGWTDGFVMEPVKRRKRPS